MRINYLLIGLVLIVAACSKTTKETPKGHKYTLLREGSGETAKAGQFLMLNLVFKDGKDSVWNDTRKDEIPMIYQMAEPSPDDEGVDEILSVLRKGDSVVFTLPASVLFEKTFRQPMPETIDGNSQFTFNAGVKDILTSDQLRVMEQEFMAKRDKVQLEKDIAEIDAFLSESNIQAMTTPSGLRYLISKEGTGDPATVGSEVAIHYAGYLLDGTLFDTSMESVAKANNAFTEGRPYEPISLSAGSGQVIPGWEEAILLMKKGSKMRVWIPSTLAYGPQNRSAVIKANSILVFDMEMVDIR